MIESKASYGAILLHQYISLWDVLPSLIQVVRPILMHLSTKRHHLLGGKDSALACYPVRIRVGNVLSRICKGDTPFYLRLFTATSVLLGFQFCKSLAPFPGALSSLL